MHRIIFIIIQATAGTIAYSPITWSGSAGYGTISNCSSSDRGSDSLDNNEVKINLHDDFRYESFAIVVAIYSYNCHGGW